LLLPGDRWCSGAEGLEGIWFSRSRGLIFGFTEAVNWVVFFGGGRGRLRRVIQSGTAQGGLSAAFHTPLSFVDDRCGGQQFLNGHTKIFFKKKETGQKRRDSFGLFCFENQLFAPENHNSKFGDNSSIFFS
jgi:hypothetical protein